MSCIDSLEPYLPLEIERLIFELAVAEHGTKASTPFLLVARRVREWTRPLIFQVINQKQHPRSEDFIPLPQLLQSIGYFVQHLIVDGYYSKESLRTMLSSCPNVHDLTIYTPLYFEGAWLNYLFPVLQGMPRLRRLTATYLDVACEEFITQPFLNLTHLHLLPGHPRSIRPEQWKSLTHLPKLTHVNVEKVTQVSEIWRLLELLPLLKILIFTPYNESCLTAYLNALVHADDNRLVCVEEGDYDDMVVDWEIGASGGMDIWIFAELVVIARARKYFLMPLPDCIPRSFDLENNLNEDGKKWFFSELRLNGH